MRKELTFSFLLAVASTALAQDLVAIDQGGRVSTINTVTGTKTLVSDYNFTDVQGLAYNSVTGKLMLVDNNQLFEFVLGGQPVFRRNLEFVTGVMNDIAIDRSGIVWGIESESGTRNLWRFGTSTGSTLIGNLDATLQLDFGLDGSLYGYGNSADPTKDGLFVVNQSTAAMTRISPAGDQLSIAGFATYSNPSGFRVAAACEFNGPFHNLDLVNGQFLSQAGTNLGILRGAAFPVAKGFPVANTLGVVNLGNLDQNPANCLKDREGVPLRICKFIVPNQSSPVIQFTLNFDGPTGMATFDPYFVPRMTTSGSFSFELELKRQSDGAFVSLGSTNVNSAYKVIAARDQPASTFLDANGAGTSRIKIRPTGPSGSSSFCFEMDQAVTVMYP